MIGSLLRAILLIVVIAGATAFLLGWWGSDGVRPIDWLRQTVGTKGVDTDRARRVATEVGERTAVAADQAGRALSDGRLTAKIKAKIALDDTVKARDINVDTTDGTVTVTGTVASEAQRERVLQLARETEGVTRVVDRLQLRR